MSNLPGTRQEETAQRGYLSQFGLSGPRVAIPVKYLSGGQRMRVALAIALVKRPDVLILDEVLEMCDCNCTTKLSCVLYWLHCFFALFGVFHLITYFHF